MEGTVIIAWILLDLDKTVSLDWIFSIRYFAGPKGQGCLFCILNIPSIASFCNWSIVKNEIPLYAVSILWNSPFSEIFPCAQVAHFNPSQLPQLEIFRASKVRTFIVSQTTNLSFLTHCNSIQVLSKEEKPLSMER